MAIFSSGRAKVWGQRTIVEVVQRLLTIFLLFVTCGIFETGTVGVVDLVISCTLGGDTVGDAFLFCTLGGVESS